MKKIVTLIAAVLLLNSCELEPVLYTDARYESLKKPVIVIAKSNQSIILRDSNGLQWVGMDRYVLGSALIKSYNVGDTIK